MTAGTGREIEWITRQMGCVFPREWEQFIAPVPDVRYDGNIATAYAPKRS